MSYKSFAEFFETWEHQHKRYINSLQNHNNDDNDNDNEQESLVEQVLLHYQDYYEAKSKAPETDVFLMFSPPWFSSYQLTLLWITGFKPSVTFRFIKEWMGGDLDDEQTRRIAIVREETRRVEREIAQAMASVQESVAAPAFCGRVKGGVGDAVEELKVAMVGVVKNADDLRRRTALEVLEVLSPGQKVKFLAGTSQFWL